MRDNNISLDEYGEQANSLEGAGRTVVYAAVDGKFAGLVAIADAVRPNAQLSARGNQRLAAQARPAREAPGENGVTMQTKSEYIPALGARWLTPLYDPLLRWGMREDAFKQQLIRQARIEPRHRVLDLGCGTATLTIWIKQSQPAAEVVGLDGDPEVLAIGRAKAAQAGVGIVLDRGMAYQLPYPDGSFDRVLSSLVLHHLTGENKQRTAREMFRVLRPGGELHVMDFGRPRALYARLIAPFMRRFEQVAENFQGLLPDYFRQAGFNPVDEPEHHETVFGTIAYYRAGKPG